MITSRQKRIASELESNTGFSPGTLAYFESRTMNDWYDFVVAKFLVEEAAGRLTRAELARRIHKSPAQVTRLLSSPSNWTLATVSNLLLGIVREQSVPQSAPVVPRRRGNYFITKDVLEYHKPPSPAPRREASTSDSKSLASFDEPVQVP